MAVIDWAGLLDQILSLGYFQTICYPAQVDATAVSADFTTDTACTELVGYWSLRIQCELYAAALAASFEFPGLG